MKQVFTFVLFQFFCGYILFAGSTGDEVPAKPEKKHHFNWLAEVQPIIGVGKYTSHQTIGGQAHVFIRNTDTTLKFVNTLYMGSFKASAGYQYKNLFYIGLGT